LSDLALGLHATLPFVYASFLVTAFLGRRIRTRRTMARVLGSALASSVVFFIVTNFGVWLTSGMYALDSTGLGTCYVAALPFFRNSLLGDLGFTSALFALENFALRRLTPRPAAA